MSIVHTHQPDVHPGLLGHLAAAFRAFFHAVMTMAEQSPRMREIDRLQAMSDADLAALGLTRDRIIQHVFRDRI